MVYFRAEESTCLFVQAYLHCCTVSLSVYAVAVLSYVDVGRHLIASRQISK